MAQLQLEFKAPGMPQPREAFATEDEQWFKLDRRFYRVARTDAPATVTFAYVDRPELIEDFLKPPMNPGPRGVARFRYPDGSGKARVFDLPLEGQEGKSIPLPDSDLTVKVEKVADFPASEGGLSRVLGEAAIPVGMFQVSKGQGAPVEHFAMASLPMVPNVMPNPRDPGAKPSAPLVSIHLMILPDLDPKTNGKFGQIDVLAGPDRSLYYRVFGRGKEGKTELRSAGPLEKGKTIDAFGGGAGMPMTIGFRLEDYLPAGVEKQIFEPLFLPISRIEEAVPASLIEMTVGRRHPRGLDPAEREPRGPLVQAGPLRRPALRDRLRREPQAAGLRAQARQVRARLRAGDRAAHQVRQPGPAHRPVPGPSRPSRTRSR